MRRFKIFVTYLVLGFLTVLSHPRVSFATDSKIIESFLHEGDDFLKKGDVSSALDRYSRGVLLAPENKNLLHRLISLKDETTLSLTQQTRLMHIHNLISHLHRLSEKFYYYKDKQDQLLDYLRQRGLDEELIQLEMKLVSKKISKSYDKKRETLYKLYLSQDNPLDMIIAALEQTKIGLMMEIDTATEQFRHLKKLNKDTPLHQDLLVKEVDLVYLRYEPTATAINQRPEQFALEQENKLDQLNNAVIELSLLLQEAKQKTERQDNQIALLKEQLSGLVSQKNLGGHLIDEKNEEILMLNQRIIDLQSQLDLRERIVQEKEVNLKQTKDRTVTNTLELTQENDMLKKIVATQKKSLRQLEAMIDIYQNKNHRDIIQNELAHAKQINQLSIEKFKEIIGEREKTIDQKNIQIHELSNIIDLYQLLLKESKDDFLASKEKIQKIEEEFIQFKKHLIEKSQILLDTEFKLMTLKKELTKVQTRLMALKNLPETKNYAQLENEMQELDDELKNIHKFLLQQLSDFEKLNKDFIAGDIEDIDKVLNLNLKRIKND